MRISLILSLLVASMSVTPFAWADADKRQPVPLPKDIAPEIIADDMRFNGAPMQIVQFFAPDAEDVLAFYRGHFKEVAVENVFTEYDVDGVKMIGALMHDKNMINVELRNNGNKRVKALVSSLKVDELRDPEELAIGIPRLSKTEVMQYQDSRDGPKSNRLAIMKNTYSVENNAMFLREHLIETGWTRDRDVTVKSGAHRQLYFSKDNKKLQIDLQKTDILTTTVIYNEVTG